MCNALAVHAAQPCHRSSVFPRHSDPRTREAGTSGLRLAGAIYVLTYIYGISTRSSCKKHRPVRWRTKVATLADSPSAAVVPPNRRAIEVLADSRIRSALQAGKRGGGAQRERRIRAVRFRDVRFPGTARSARRVRRGTRPVARGGTVTCPGTWYLLLAPPGRVRVFEAFNQRWRSARPVIIHR